MKWFEVELEIPIYGKNFEIIQADDQDTAKEIALRRTVVQYNLTNKDVYVSVIKEIKN